MYLLYSLVRMNFVAEDDAHGTWHKALSADRIDRLAN